MVATLPLYHYNPAMHAYVNFTNTRAVYFKTLLESLSFNHVEGNVVKNAFDAITDFKDAYDSGLGSETIFKVNGYYVLGYYKRQERKYYLRKFEN